MRIVPCSSFARLTLVATVWLCACGKAPVPATVPPADAAPAHSAPIPKTAAASAIARDARSADGTYIVRWLPVNGAIPEAEVFGIAIEIVRTDGSVLAKDAVVTVDAEMPHHGHGMNLVPTVSQLDPKGNCVAEGLLFHMPGRWVLAIDVEEGGVSERTQWYVDIE